jgi:hypothetical protein
MAEIETAEAPEAAPTEVTPGGGIITRDDGKATPAPTDWRASLPL